MSVRVNVRLSKIKVENKNKNATPIKVDVRTYATYANCRAL